MLKCLVTFLIFGFFIHFVRTDVVITELSGTNNAEYGTSHSLQCSYDFSNETGVEIKWFYNGDNQMFLWIPRLTKPNALDPWKDLLDTNDTTDHDVKHSVIHFKELNFNLTGHYTCKVTGDEHEATKTERMIVYRSASFIEFDIVSDENNTITLKCSVFEVYPIPSINATGLYLLERNATVPIYLSNETIDGDQNSFVNISRTFTFNKNELVAPAVELRCTVAIAETNYSVVKTLEYFSGYETTTSSNYEYYPNDMTKSPVNETSVKISSLNNYLEQGGFASFNSALYKWQIMLLLIVTHAGKWFV